ncbi:MAG: hypothetical protein LWY06_17750 [Firmicutes bacterium]|nr:hypothetical protein [Bacillota bacterium]
MIIAGSMIKMLSNTESKKSHIVDEELQVWNGGVTVNSDRHLVETEVTSQNSAGQSATATTQAKSFDLPLQNMADLTTNQKKRFWEDAAHKLMDSAKKTSAPVASSFGSTDLTSLEDLKNKLIEMMLYHHYGKDAKLQPGQLKTLNTTITVTNVAAAGIQIQQSGAQVQTPAQAPAQAAANWGIRFDKVETYSESQDMAFTAEGSIQTEDGKQIDIKFDLALSRDFFEKNEIHIRAGTQKTVDPLMLSFDGTAPGLTDQKYDFDLDSDGKQEQVSFASANAGFLALDENNNGKIDNGGELFGPETGSGFKELAQYDDDGNNWIDEKDKIFSKLIIWQKDPNGNDSYSSLQQKNVGAIYLGNVASAFDFKDDANQTQGEVKKSGVFLTEDGQAGAVQQVDLAV